MERYNLVVIGAGSGGLVVAAGAAGLGARVALVEKHLMGGDCLNTGCVPSKALLAAAREARRRGVAGREDEEFAAAMRRVREARARIAPHDSVERFTGLGVDVVSGTARVVSPHEVEAAGRRLWGRHLVVATGSRPVVPEVAGLAEAGFLTNEAVFELDGRPASLVVIGGGPIGCELGQAFARLGTRVTIVSASGQLCPREEPDASDLLRRRLEEEGVRVLLSARPARARRDGGRKVVTLDDGREVAGDELLVAAGRRPAVDGLGLEAAGVRVTGAGVAVDDRCRTNVRSVWAVGDAAGPPFFTHRAAHQARTVVRNTLFPGSARCDLGDLPRVTFTDPEIGQVGLTRREAEERGVRHDVVEVRFEAVDRAVCEGERDGHLARVLAGPRGEILGATVVHPRAGDLLAELVVARRHGVTLAGLSGTIHAYPTHAEVGRALGDAFMRTKLTPGRRAFLARVLGWARR